MSSDEVWYRANKISGIALIVAGIFWLIVGLTLPSVMGSAQAADRAITGLGLGAILTAVALSFWLTYKK